ncbi:uncharacterized protein LOC130299185 [Hyla sarda]|uniref:uncharacterized protein LOC130299185 n=1 Tax=Hyla sarda TaxID=327740 RepID=UPI0024C279D9|nr:uncharacterized protein LOC130299185 [Hyla sarda]
MPSCIVKGCTSTWRKKDPTVTRHTFPWEPERIRIWLLQTGQYDANMNKMIQKILDGKVNDTYRMCSKHFEHHCYTYEEDRRRLRKDAIPTVFPPTSGLRQQQASTLSTTQHITPVCTPTTTIVTFSSSSSGSHTSTTSALSLGSSISSVVSVTSPVLPTSEQHSTNSSSDVVLSVPPNAVILPPTWPPLEIFPSSQSTSQRKENLTPQKRDFSTNTMPFLFFPPKGPKVVSQKKRRKRLCSSLPSFDGIPTNAPECLPSEVVPQMSSELISIEILTSDTEEQEPSDLSSNLEPFEMPSETSTESTGSEVTMTSKLSKKRSTPFNLRAASQIEIPEFIKEHNYYSNIEQEDTGLSDMSPQPREGIHPDPQPTEGIHPDPSDTVEPISPIEFRDQKERAMVVCFVKGCTPKSREGRGDVTLHVFPKDKDQIREWLMATGESIPNIEELVNKIYDTKKVDLYRMCSLHFAPNCYIFNPKTGKRRLANMAVPSIFPRKPKTAECSSQVTSPRLGKRRRVTIAAGSRCPTCNQIVGPSQDFQPVTSEPSPRKEFAEKFTIFDRSYGTASKYVQTYLRTFSVKSQCQMRPPKKTSCQTSALSNIFVFGSPIQGTTSGPPFQGTTSGPPVQGTSGPPVQGTSTEKSSSQKETELSDIPQEPSHTIPIESTPVKTIPHTQTSDAEVVHREGLQAEPIVKMAERGISSKQRVFSIGIQEEQPSLISEDTNHPGNSWAESHRRRKKSVDIMDDQLGNLEDLFSRMPACVVNGCSTANRGSETLHMFPRDKGRIRTWLMATGQYSHDLEEAVNKIFNATKKSDSYRMCAKHFAPYCFIYNAKTGKEILTKNAVPTIFPHRNATAFPPATKRKRSEMAAYTQDSDSEFSSTDESGETEDSQEDSEKENYDVEGEEVIFSKRNFGDHPPCYIHPVKQRKFIVFENSLDELILKIPCQSAECTSPITKIIKKRTGSYISIFVECADHDYNLLWESQPTIDGKPLGNVILASAIFESGNSFPKMKQFFHLMNIMAMSENAYSKYQHDYIFPTIEHSWKISQMASIENVQGPPVCISGDGRWDSLGNNDKFCVYSMMDMETKKILSFDVQQSAMGVSSPESEKIACKNALDFLLQNEISVKLLCTDRHFPIRKMVKEEYPTITHEFNVRQIAKSVGDKLLDASHEKDCEDLAEWVGAIQSHLRWCSDSYNGDDSLLMAKWNSILYHVQNVHAWEDKDGKYSSCQHKHLPEDTTRKRKWLKTNSPSFKALKKIVLDKRLRKDIKRICHFCHTGDIEVFLSAIVKYQSDQKEHQHVTIDEMYARTQLASLDHNTSCRKIRAMARRSSRTSAGSHRYNTADSKDRSERYGPEMYKPTNQDFLIDLMQEVVELVSGNRSFEWSSHTIPRRLNT